MKKARFMKCQQNSERPKSLSCGICQAGLGNKKMSDTWLFGRVSLIFALYSCCISLPKNYKISSPSSYNFILALTLNPVMKHLNLFTNT